MDDHSRSGGRFDAREMEVIRKALAREKSTHCPRCHRRLERTDLPPRADVPYVRRRILLVCGACGARAVLDRREVDRPES